MFGMFGSRKKKKQGAAGVKKPGLTKRFFTSTFNLKSWVGTDRIGRSNSFIKDNFHSVFDKREPARRETMSAAMRRLNITEEGLKQRQHEYLLITIAMIFIALCVLTYTLYLWLQGAWRGGIVGTSVTCIACALVFRYHFWYFQIKRRKLGCTIKEWFNEGVLGKEPESKPPARIDE